MLSDSIDAPSGDPVAGADVLDPGKSSRCSVAVACGSSVMLWHSTEFEAGVTLHCKLRLSPDQPAIIGRFEGTGVHYLDPSYRPTRLVPGTGQNIMRSEGFGRDRCVSRAHFMLRAASRGILLVNGVPRPGGGLRAPPYGTWLILPDRGRMGAGEEFLIESGVTAVIVLPNGSEVQIGAE